MKGVLIDKDVLVLFRQAADKAHFKHEVGGILLGSIRGEYLHIVLATLPQKKDRFNFSRFWRSSEGHQEQASRSWNISGKTVTYLGEWHSHPERIASPSQIDYTDWKKQLQRQKRDLVFIIQGMEGLYLACGNRLGSIVKFQKSIEDDQSVLWCHTPD